MKWIIEGGGGFMSREKASKDINNNSASFSPGKELNNVHIFNMLYSYGPACTTCIQIPGILLLSLAGLGFCERKPDRMDCWVSPFEITYWLMAYFRSLG